MSANPSAVSGHDETKPDLLDFSMMGGYQHLPNSEGLIEAYTYYTSTTANCPTPGSHKGSSKKEPRSFMAPR